MRRSFLAYRRSHFRKNSSVFYTVQSAADENRLRGVGFPWPTYSMRAHLGEGVYSWDNRKAAEAYKQALEQRVSGLRIVAFRISRRVLQSLRQMDIDALGDPGADEWFQR